MVMNFHLSLKSPGFTSIMLVSSEKSNSLWFKVECNNVSILNRNLHGNQIKLIFTYNKTFFLFQMLLYILVLIYIFINQPLHTVRGMNLKTVPVPH